MKRPPIHVVPGLFLRYEPIGEAVPLLIDVSSSGREYPEEFRSALPFTRVHAAADLYVEDLWAGAPGVGATLLYCSYPRAWVDVDRPETEIGPDGELTARESEERLSRYYRPYHSELKRLADDLHHRFGVLRHVSCRSMSDAGGSDDSQAGRHADFCVGDLGGTSASSAAVDLMVETLKGYGYSVALNDPCPGGELVRRIAQPAKGIHSIALAVNRRLFIEAQTSRPTEDFPKVRNDLDRLLRVLAKEMVKLARRA